MANFSRREVLGVFGLGALAIRAADPPFQFSMLDHLEFFVSDVQKSTAFYARVFGNTVMKNNQTTRRYVKLGSAYVAIDTGQQIRVDHICAGIPSFNIANVHNYLRQQAIEYRDYPSGKDLSIGETDGGVRLQLAAENGWNALMGNTASPESIALKEEAIFLPSGLDHILLNVPDLEDGAAFYEKILGPADRRDYPQAWFQVGTSRLGLQKTLEGERAGVNRFCVGVAPFEYQAAAMKLEEAGAKLDAPQDVEAPTFRDPDGYLVQITRTRA